MTGPKIARRCPDCGASIREHAFFCPQCGNHLGQKELDSLGATRAQPPDPQDAQAVPDRSETAPLRESKSHESTILPDRVGSPVVRGARDTIHRATTAARNVIEDDLPHHAQQLRKISTVVWEEAAYDPGLRFVLVAVALFVLFLLILFLSELIR